MKGRYWHATEQARQLAVKENAHKNNSNFIHEYHYIFLGGSISIFHCKALSTSVPNLMLLSQNARLFCSAASLHLKFSNQNDSEIIIHKRTTNISNSQ